MQIEEQTKKQICTIHSEHYSLSPHSVRVMAKLSVAWSTECRRGILIDMEFIQSELRRRRPGQSHITTQRNEQDQVELLSGVFEGKSTGCPIGFIVRNTNQHSADYDDLRSLFRPSTRRLHVHLQIRHTRPSWWRTFVGTHHHKSLCGRSTRQTRITTNGRKHHCLHITGR